MRRLALTCLLPFVVAPSLAAAAECRATSGASTAALVELYTSEGCSSCPPADRWLGAIPRDSISAGRVVPIAFHVSYWDRLGWKDPFAREDFNARQRDQQRIERLRYVYTPQVVLAGRDHPRWAGADLTRSAKEINATPARAVIDLVVNRADAATEVRASAKTLSPDANDVALYVALVESGLTSNVAAGENRGRTLAHAHVARAWSGAIPLRDGQANATLRESALTGKEIGAVAFVQDRATGRVLQALSLPACP